MEVFYNIIRKARAFLQGLLYHKRSRRFVCTHIAVWHEPLHLLELSAHRERCRTSTKPERVAGSQESAVLRKLV